MPIYKSKEQRMRNLLFIFLKHIPIKHLCITCHIYRHKQYVTNIRILRILIIIATAAIILVIINNNNINNNNYNCNKKRNQK